MRMRRLRIIRLRWLFCSFLFFSCVLFLFPIPTVSQAIDERQIPLTPYRTIPEVDWQIPQVSLDSEDGAEHSVIIYSDFPGCFFQRVLSEWMPQSHPLRLNQRLAMSSDLEPFTQLMSENQVYPYLSFATADRPRQFLPLYRATITLAVDLLRADPVRSWSELSERLESDGRLGFFTEPEWALGSLVLSKEATYGVNDLLELSSCLRKRGDLYLYLGVDSNVGWPSSLFQNEQLLAESLPTYLVLWDYQVAQLNALMGSDRYEAHIPAEGGLMVEMGLYGQGEEAVKQLKSLAEIKEQSGETSISNALDPLSKTLTANGYRLPDGRSIANPLGDYYSALNPNLQLVRRYGYPLESEYAKRQIRIKNYQTFNQEVMTHLDRFRGTVLSDKPLNSLRQDRRQLFILLSVPFLVLWISFIYYRLDDAHTKKPMSLILFWISVSWLLFFVQSIYTQSESLQYLMPLWILPTFGYFESWFFCGENLAVSRLTLQSGWRKWTGLVTFLTYITAILCILRDMNWIAQGQWNRLEQPDVLSMIAASLLLLLGGAGLYLLRKCQPDLRWYNLMPPLFFLAGLLFQQMHRLSYQRGTLDLTNQVLQILLSIGLVESCLSFRLIPGNLDYARLFRYAPIHLRLMSENLQFVYPENQPLSLNNLRRIRKAVAESVVPEKQERRKISFFRRNDIQNRPVFRDGEILKVKDSKDPNRLYLIGTLTGGFLIWEEDVEALNRLRQELSKVNAQLADQGQLLEKETTVKSQYLSMTIRRKLLNEIEQSLSDKMKQMQGIFDTINEHRENPTLVRHELGRVKILVSQCKRKSNLLVRGEADIDLKEMQLIFKEGLADASTSGIQGACLCRGDGTIPVKTVIPIYDYWMMLLERSVDLDSPSLFINFVNTAHHCQMRVLFHSGQNLSEETFRLSQQAEAYFANSGAQVSCEVEGREATLNFRIAKGGIK